MNEQRRLQLNTQRLSTVVPELRVKCEKVISDLEDEGLRPLITCGYRSNEEQRKLYEQGRTRAGKIVTFAKPGQSLHNHKKAVDFAFLDKDGEIDWSDKHYKRLGVIAKFFGLKWGGDFRKFKDRPHVEI